MRGWLRPQGRESARTYWVRRAVVVVGAVILTVGLTGLVASFLPKKTSQTHQIPITTSSVTVPSEVSVSDTPRTPSSSSVTTPTAATPPPAPMPVECQPSEIGLALSGTQNVKLATEVPITVTATNKSQQTCVIAIAASQLQVVVSSGTDRIWSSADCAAWLAATTTPVAGQQSVQTKLTWPNRRSTPGSCELRSETLGKGTYVVRAKFKDGPPASLVVTVL